MPGIVAEGCSDYFFGRPLDANPYARDWSSAWESWRWGWLEGAMFERMRGARERARWWRAA